MPAVKLLLGSVSDPGRHVWRQHRHGLGYQSGVGRRNIEWAVAASGAAGATGYDDRQGSPDTMVEPVIEPSQQAAVVQPLNRPAARASITQPSRHASPPIGVMAPNQRWPVSTSR